MKKTEGVRKSRRQRSARNGNGKPIRELMKLRYKIELTPLAKEDGGGYLAVIPLLRGCHSDGKTPDEAIENLREAQAAWFSSALKHDDPIPRPQR
jgi:predicted RNase H-like HicB family nuclease